MNRASALLLIVFFLESSAIAMELGGNFWNPGWHKTSDCFRDVNNVSGADPWNPQFLKEITCYRSLRFMDWDNTNGSKRERWRERPAPDNPKQNPVAYEWMIDLCNRNGSSMWITVPHRSITRHDQNRPSDYALRLFLLVKTGIDMGEVDLITHLETLAAASPDDLQKLGGVKSCQPLRPDLKIYVEYSNETWNGIFEQAHYSCDEGIALGLDSNRWTAGFKYHAWAAIRLFRAADLVFGKDSPRLVKVIATQSSNSWIVGRHLEVLQDSALNPWSVKATAIATAPYFGGDVTGDSANALRELRLSIRKSAEDSAKHKSIAEQSGLLLIAYEGGQHVTRKAKEINRSPLMHDLYCEYLAEMEKYFSLFAHYCHVGQAGDGGAWGAIEHTGQPLSEAHKYRALVDWVAKKRR